MLLIQCPSKSLYLKIVIVMFGVGGILTSTRTPPVLILPETAAAIPGTATTLLTIASPKVLEFAIAD
jgi:hypothetical protein